MANVKEPKAPQLLIPKEKVFRQIFDAEVQLVKSLEKSRGERHGASEADVNTRQVGFPLVHLKLPTIGMLDDRQLHWLKEFPNEPYTENPIAYKFFHDDIKDQLKETVQSLEAKEVRELPDVVVPGKVGSDIAERILTKRQRRHEAAMEDLFQEFGLIGDEMEMKVTLLGEGLLDRLRESDMTVEETLACIDSDEELFEMTMAELDSIWEIVSAQTRGKKNDVAELDKKLEEIEVLRMEKVREVFAKGFEKMEKIGHLALPKLQLMLDKECQIMNQMVLANKRSYSNLNARLMLAIIEQEKKHYLHWLELVGRWKHMQKDDVLRRFERFMSHEDIVNPLSAEEILDEMIDKQKSLNKKRLKVLSSVRDLDPAALDKAKASRLRQKFADISKDLESVNQSYYSELLTEYEQICQSCLKKVDRVKRELIEEKICTEPEVTELINTRCLTLVGEQQAKFEQIMEKMDKSLEEHSSVILNRTKPLMKLCKKLASYWDKHEDGLEAEEDALKEKLEETRDQHETNNQNLESVLVRVLDSLRQGANEANLQRDLKLAQTSLESIKNGYETFHKEQLEVVGAYPKAVEERLTDYENNVCTLFGVRRVVQDENQKSDGDSKNDPNVIVTERGTIYKSEVGRKLSDLFTDDKSEDEIERPSEETLPEDGAEEEEQSANASRKSSEQQTANYLQSFDIDEKLILEIGMQVRLNVLNHLDSRILDAKERANTVVEAKTTELQKELELRIRLHDPRAKRVELDIYNVRAAELVMHSERVARHSKCVEQTLNELKQKCSVLPEDHNKMAEKFMKDINQVESTFVNASKSSVLTELSRQLTVLQEKFMEQIRTSIRQFRQQLDQSIQKLQQSTAQLIKSFKLFSEGGNFSPEEVKDFHGRLQKLSTKTDQWQGSLIGSLENIEAKRLDQSLKVTRDFEEKFKYHQVDLVFIESISRWLTNTQVKIKAEVALSNSEAKAIADMLSRFERRVDACEHPSPDKEFVEPAALASDLVSIYEAIQKRSVYLQCLKDPVLASAPVNSMQGNPALGVRSSALVEGLNCVSRPGKLQLDDPSITVIKNILRSQKVPGENEPPLNAVNSSSSIATKASTKGSKKTPKEVQQQQQQQQQQKKTRTIASGKGKIDLKYFVFGEGPEPGEETFFQGKINGILRETLEALLTTAEMFYRQKGIRQVTRPNVLKDNFDDCAELLVQKCQFYSSQCDDYQNECLQEFRQQLSQLETLSARVPPVVITDIKWKALTDLQNLINKAEGEFKSIFKESHQTMEKHEDELRPYLGHPQKQNELEDLCQRETDRQRSIIETIAQHTDTLKTAVHQQADTFLQDLARTSENLFLQFDNMLVVDEVESGRQPSVTLSPEELLRQHKQGQPAGKAETKVEVVDVARGRNTWPGLPLNELKPQPASSSSTSVAKADKKRDSKDLTTASLTTASVTTAKTTLGHMATVNARNSSYEEYKSHILSTLQKINDNGDKRMSVEKRWVENWSNSVDKLKQLYC